LLNVQQIAGHSSRHVSCEYTITFVLFQARLKAGSMGRSPIATLDRFVPSLGQADSFSRLNCVPGSIGIPRRLVRHSEAFGRRSLWTGMLCLRPLLLGYPSVLQRRANLALPAGRRALSLRLLCAFWLRSQNA
jgi:hypothetical protein